MLERILRQLGNRGEQLLTELASQRGRDLRHLLARHDPVQARHQGILQRSRNRARRQRARQEVAIARVLQEARLEHGLGQLLDKQRYAVGALDDVLEHLVRKRFPAGHPADELGAFPAAQAAELDRNDIRKIVPARLEPRPMRADKHHPLRHQPFRDHLQKLRARGIDPMQVLHDEQHRNARRHGFDHREQGLDRALLALLGARGAGRIALAQRQRQQGCERRNVARERQAQVGEPPFELGELLRRAVVPRETQPMLELLDHGVIGRVPVIGRAHVHDALLRYVADPILEPAQHPRFADARLPGEQNRGSFALDRPLPAFEQEAQLLFAPDQRHQSKRRFRLEAASYSAFAEHAVGAHRMRDAFQALRAELFADIQSLDEPEGVFAYHDCAGARERLQPRRDVGCLADDAHFFSAIALADVADHDHAGIDADAHRQRQRACGDPLIELFHGFHDVERRAHRALGIVLVGLRVAEIDEQRVAHVSAQVAARALHRIDAGVPIVDQQRGQLLRIEPLGERRGVDEVAKQHREMAMSGRRVGIAALIGGWLRRARGHR